jgi:Fur family ferric uptake transcriptional regulator
LVCTNCGKTIEIEPPDEQWVRRIAKRHGFTVSSHTVEVFGLCPDCQQAN